MSKPPTQKKITADNSAGVSATSPRIAIQAEIGASIKAAPSQKWASDVNRLA